MDPRLESLFSSASPKEFTAKFKGLREAYPDIDSFLSDLVAALAPRLYEPFYDEAPRGLYGLTCAALAEDLFEDRWRPYAQQIWGLRVKRRMAAFPLPAPAPHKADRTQRWVEFRDAIQGRDLERVLSFARSFLCEPDERNFFRARLSMLALADLALGGHKFNYVVQSWSLAEKLGFRQVEQALFGPLHLLTLADRCTGTAELIDATGEFPALSELDSDLDSGLESEAGQAFIEATAEGALRALQALFRRRVRLERLYELLLTSAARVLANARRGAWLPGVRAFHAAFFTAECANWLEPEERLRSVALCSLIINQASLESRAVEANPPLDEVIRRFCPTSPFEVLRSVISHSDPFASATAVHAILGMDDQKKEELFRTLAAQAAKNDGANCWGHDLLLVSQARRAYQRSAPGRGALFPVVAGFCLGQVPKSYTLAAEYGV